MNELALISQPLQLILSYRGINYFARQTFEWSLLTVLSTITPTLVKRYFQPSWIRTWNFQYRKNKAHGVHGTLDLKITHSRQSTDHTQTLEKGIEPIGKSLDNNVCFVLVDRE